MFNKKKKAEAERADQPKPNGGLPDGIVAVIYFNNGVSYMFKENTIGETKLKDIWAAAQKVGER